MTFCLFRAILNPITPKGKRTYENARNVMYEYFLAIGSNLGDKKQNLSTAIKLMEEQIGVLVRQSAFLATEPWGFQSGNSFVNADICMETELDPCEVLERTQKIEREMGRTVKSTNGEYHDRIIDIDILLFDDLKIKNPRLTIPHPLMEQRDFVMIPLREILLSE